MPAKFAKAHNNYSFIYKEYEFMYFISSKRDLMKQKGNREKRSIASMCDFTLSKISKEEAYRLKLWKSTI